MVSDEVSFPPVVVPVPPVVPPLTLPPIVISAPVKKPHPHVNVPFSCVVKSFLHLVFPPITSSICSKERRFTVSLKPTFNNSNEFFIIFTFLVINIVYSKIPNLYYFNFQSLYHPFLHILLRHNIKKQIIRQYTSNSKICALYCYFWYFMAQIYYL